MEIVKLAAAGCHLDFTTVSKIAAKFGFIAKIET